MKDILMESAEADFSAFKKKLKKMAEYKGRGTELISLYLPPDVDRSSVMNQLGEEVGQSANIKSQITRKNVQGALRKVLQFLKQIDFKLPETGLVVFSGNISAQEGKPDLRLFTLKPPQKLRTKMYWCDSSFHLAPLEEMVKPTDVYALLTIDKRESTMALLVGKKYEIIGKFTSNVAGKIKAGGQSAHRFEQLREEAEKEFFKRVQEKMNAALVPLGEKLKGIIVAGPGITKNEFLERGEIDYRLKGKILGTLDITYTDESGIREAVQKSGELLKEAEITRERNTVNKFFEEVGKNGLAVYGQEAVEAALAVGKVGTLLLSEAIDWIVVKVECESCANYEEKIVKNPLRYNASSETCGKCKSSQVEVIEQVDYIDWLIEKAQSTGSKTQIISTETPEGDQFYRSFGGIGALLRFK